MNDIKFDGMGSVYAQFRPSYPQEFIDYLYSDIGMAKTSVIADIGSGTGILTRQLLTYTNTVFAVEPNADMRAVAEADLHCFDGFVSVNGSAESTSLEQGNIDFITVAQAFHWFDKQRFKWECKRLLKPNGKVVLVWNCRDESSDLVRENDAIIRKYCPTFKGYAGGIFDEEGKADFSDFFSGQYETKVFRNDLAFDIQGFIGRNLSGSYAPKKSDNHHASYVAELESLFEKYNNQGIIIMPNLTQCYVGSV
jgi:SAM-dependent methyltransferase